MRLLAFRRGLTAAAAVVAAAVALASEPAAQEPIRIGTFLALTGPRGTGRRGAEEDAGSPTSPGSTRPAASSAGSWSWRPTTPAAMATNAVAGAARLLDEGRSDFLIGGTTPGEAQAVGQLVERSERPFISLAGLRSLERQQHWAFTAAPSLRMAVEKVLVDLRKERIDELGLIAGSSTSDVACLTEARSAAARREVVIKAVEQYQQADLDVTRQLSHLRAAGADAILFCGFGAPGIIVTRNLAQLRLDLPLYHTHASCSRQLIAGSGSAAEGVRLPCPALLVAGQLPPDDPQRGVALAYAQTYAEAYGEQPSAFGGYAHDALHLLVDAIRRAGSTEPQPVRDALEATSGFVGAAGKITMNANNTTV